MPALAVAHAQLPDDPERRWKTVIPVIADLKEKAKKLGLWNLFLSKAHYPQWGVPLSNLEVPFSELICACWARPNGCVSMRSWLRSLAAVASLHRRP